MPYLGETKKVYYPCKDRPRGSSHTFIWHACVDCGKERWVQFIKDKPTRLRCRSCAPREVANRTVQKGRFISIARGYVYVRLKSDDFFYPMTTKNGYVLEHRLIVARALGRNLHPWELVHHKGAKYPKGSKEDKQDNRYPENLQLVTDDRHNQITVLENRIRYLERRVTLLEAENIVLKQQIIPANRIWEGGLHNG